VRLRDVFESDSHLFLVQELCTGGNLQDMLRQTPEPMSEARAARLFRGIVKSVLHCHQVRAHGTPEGKCGGQCPHHRGRSNAQAEASKAIRIYICSLIGTSLVRPGGPGV